MFHKFSFALILCFIFEIAQLIGQASLVADFSMDDCTLTDNRGQYTGINFATTCECGVQSNGLSFDGDGDFAEFDNDLNELLKEDWTISFYVQLKNQGTRSVDLLFIGDRCGLDSILSLRYLPATLNFRFNLSDSPNNEVQLDGRSDVNSCWQYIAITKEGTNFSMYVNGFLEDQGASTSLIRLSVNSPMTISNSPCQNFTPNQDVPFEGIIDEYKIFDRALSSREIEDANLFPDKIITRDTTIFEGTSITLETGGSCSPDFQWSPSTALNDPSLLSPTSSPADDITYTLTVNGDNCQSVSQVTIRLADPSVLTCGDLLLPSAFTPNNDRINDNYGISNQFLISDLRSFEIFNRWGGRVFFTNDRTGSWDGSYKGEPAPPNSYIYKVTYVCDNQTFNKTGSVNLIR